MRRRISIRRLVAGCARDPGGDGRRAQLDLRPAPGRAQADRFLHPGRQAAHPLPRTARQRHPGRADPRPAGHGRRLGRGHAAARGPPHDRDRPARLRLLDRRLCAVRSCSCRCCTNCSRRCTSYSRSSSATPTAGRSRSASPSATRSQVRGLVLVDAAAAGQQGGAFGAVQAHAVQILQLPVIRQVANVTFAQLLHHRVGQPGRQRSLSPAGGRRPRTTGACSRST